MEEAGTSREENKIQTFVFFDLETTGLPKDSPHIIELSLIAISRTHLLGMKDSATLSSTPPGTEKLLTSSPGCSSSQSSSSSAEEAELPKQNELPKLPRVLHKYSRLYYPRKLVPPNAEKIHGLSNDILEHLPSFTQASAEALVLFLDLPKPVALVAHNGNRYDFPLLMAELTRVGCVDKFVEVQCVDTLNAVKDIDSLIEREDITEITKLAKSFSTNDLSDDLEEEESILVKRQRSLVCEESANQQVAHNSSYQHDSMSGERGNHHGLEVCAEPLLTPMKNRLPGQPYSPATPLKSSHPPAHPYTPEAAPQPGTPGTSSFCATATKESRKVRRTLTYDNKGKRKLGARLSYTQSGIYKRLFNRTFTAHRAESDCEALLTICGHYGSKFVEWADTFATKLCAVEPMWLKRKTFSTN